MKKLLRIGTMLGALGILSTALAFQPAPIDFAVEDAECAEGTCCRAASSACPGVGEGWYQTGLCGPCYALHECVIPPKGD